MQPKSNDLIVAVIADIQQIADKVLEELDKYLMGGVPVSTTSTPHSLPEGLVRKPNATLAVISIPGEYTAREARHALETGFNVFLFSDNVSVQDELELKQFATEKYLLVMGSDCGTSLIGGVGIGFANVVRRGPIGVIGAAGMELQEFPVRFITRVLEFLTRSRQAGAICQTKSGISSTTTASFLLSAFVHFNLLIVKPLFWVLVVNALFFQFVDSAAAIIFLIHES